MKRFIITSAIILIAAITAYAQKNTFGKTINEWAKYSGFSVEKFDQMSGQATLSRTVGSTTQFLKLQLYENFVELEVLFYSVDKLYEFTGENFHKLLITMLSMNSEYPFGGWGISKDSKDQFFFGMFYGIPTDALDKNSFKFISNAMVKYSGEMEEELANFQETRKGFGFAGNDDTEEFLNKIKEYSKKFSEEMRKEFGK